MHKKRRGYHVLPSEFFCPTVPKIFVGKSSMFQKFRGIEKIIA